MGKVITYQKVKRRLEEFDEFGGTRDNTSRTAATMAKSLNPKSEESNELQNIDLLEELRERVVGQDHVLEEVVPLFYRFDVGLAPTNQPLGIFLLLGPTGTGKTFLVESLAEILVGSSKAVFKVDCAEFSHGHEIAKLVGAPPGYLGHRETHAFFSQQKLQAAQTETFRANFVLFDEIEKASDTLYNLLLGILDKGTLTLGDNTQVNFNKSFIFMTSNLGAKELQEHLGPGYGLKEHGQQEDPPFAKTEKIALEAARRHFLPEFMNRIDVACVYKPLAHEALDEILDQVLWNLQERIAGVEKPFVLRFPEETRESLLKAGTSKRYGARELKRTVERLVTRPLTLKMRQEPKFFEKTREVEVLVDGTTTVFKATLRS